MDHTEKLEMTRTPDVCFRATKSQHETLGNGGRISILTPDDILTLKLLRDEEQKQWVQTRHFKRRDTSSEALLETLERILKQVG